MYVAYLHLSFAFSWYYKIYQYYHPPQQSANGQTAVY